MTDVFHLFFGWRKDEENTRTLVPHVGKKTPGCELIYTRMDDGGEGTWVSSTQDESDVTHIRTELIEEEVNAILLRFNLTQTAERRLAVRECVSPAELQQWSVEENGRAVTVVKCRRNENVLASHVDRCGLVKVLPIKNAQNVTQVKPDTDTRAVFHIYYSTEDGTLRPGASHDKAEYVLVAFKHGRELYWKPATGNGYRLYGSPGVRDAKDADAELLLRTFGLHPSDLAPADALKMSPRALWRLAFALKRNPRVSCGRTGKLALAVCMDNQTPTEEAGRVIAWGRDTRVAGT